MDKRELKKSVDAVRTVAKSHRGSPEKARAFLTKAGITTKSGQLTAKYKKIA